MRDVLVAAFKERNEKHPECELIFNREGKKIVDFRKAWAKACSMAEVKGLHFHDPRRSAGLTQSCRKLTQVPASPLRAARLPSPIGMFKDV